MKALCYCAEISTEPKFMVVWTFRTGVYDIMYDAVVKSGCHTSLGSDDV